MENRGIPWREQGGARDHFTESMKFPAGCGEISVRSQMQEKLPPALPHRLMPTHFWGVGLSNVLPAKCQACSSNAPTALACPCHADHHSSDSESLCKTCPICLVVQSPAGSGGTQWVPSNYHGIQLSVATPT